MAVVKPFKGVRYDTEKVDYNDVIAPPYDVISDELQDQLYNKSDYNIVRVDYGKRFENDSDTENRYSRAAEELSRWIKEGILVSDSDSYYLIEQEYTLEDGSALRRKGLIGRVKIEELGKGVKPHERTLDAPKEDRFKLTKAVHGNLSPVFSLYRDNNMVVENIIDSMGEPDITFTDTVGIKTKVWILDDKEAIEKINSMFSDKKLFIADGHHRYETAINYKNYYKKENNIEGEDPVDYVLMYLVNSEDKGLVILPTHRLVFNLPFSNEEILNKLEPYFDVIKLDNFSSGTSVNDYFKKLNEMEAPFLFVTKEAVYQLNIKDKEKLNEQLDELPEPVRLMNVNILHRFIFEKLLGISIEDQAKQTNVKYYKEMKQALKDLNEGKGDAIFLLKALTMDDVVDATEIGERMPQKSTYFYPKIPTGIVAHLFDYQK